MMSQELRLREPQGQLSHEDIDAHFMDISLAGRNVDRMLGSFASARLRGADYQLDDDTIFSVRHEAVDAHPMAGSDKPPSQYVLTGTGHETLF